MKILNRQQAGGKGFELQRLKSFGFNVPEFYILTQADFEKYQSDLSKWPDFTTCLNLENVAVRSSGSLEDGIKNSFAGVFTTLLNIKGADQLKFAIQEVWNSKNSALVQNYLKNSGLSQNDFQFSIVIQKMINPDFAGVSFSADPVSGLRTQMLISFIDGLGDQIVSGDLSGTSYTVDSFGKQIKKSGQLELPRSILTQLIKATKNAAILLKQPVDLEWASVGDELFVLQARPVTSPLGHTGTLKKTVFDNSNIQESYNGVTTPLTYSYAVEAYKQVYNQIMKLMAMPEADFQQAQYRHSHMLGLIEGRVYYNINSWYEGLLCLPHFGRQKEAMEKMMGLEKPVEFVQDVNLSPLEKLQRLPGMMVLVVRLFYQFSKIKGHVHTFQNWFEELEVKFDPQQNQFFDNDQLIRRLYDFQKETLEHWGVPILNDFLVMMTHGSMKKEAEKMGLEAELHQAMQGSDVESLKPSEDLQMIAQMMIQNQVWQEIGTSQDPEFINLVLKTKYPEISQKIEQHLKLFGDRSFAELKLETVTYRQNQQGLYLLLRELSQSTRPPQVHDNKDCEHDFLASYKSKAGFIKNLFIKGRLKKLKFAVASRELMRLHRTRVFGMNREYYLEIGRRLTHLNVLKNYRDVFFLTRQEIFDYFWAHSITTNFQELVELRKKDWAKFENRKLPQQVEVSVPNSYWNQFLVNQQAIQDAHLMELQGLGCSNGIIRGIVKKISSPNEATGLNDKILLAERTDPGWTPLFSLIKGAIIERGSALSHSAVIAREMGLPVVVGVDRVTDRIFDGDEVEINGQTGLIRILKRRNDDGARPTQSNI